MPGDFGELTVNIGLGINFLAGGTFYFNSNDTLSYEVFETDLQMFFLCGICFKIELLKTWC